MTPAATPGHASIRLRPCAAAATAARTMVRDTCMGRLPAALIEDAALVTGVLVTHSVRHARTPIRVRVEVSGSTVLVCVDDRATELPPLTGHSTGYGLDLVARLAHRCGFVRTETGRQAWALLDGSRRPDRAGPGPSVQAAA